MTRCSGSDSLLRHATMAVVTSPKVFRVNTGAVCPRGPTGPSPAQAAAGHAEGGSLRARVPFPGLRGQGTTEPVAHFLGHRAGT